MREVQSKQSSREQLFGSRKEDSQFAAREGLVLVPPAMLAKTTALLERLGCTISGTTSGRWKGETLYVLRVEPVTWSFAFLHESLDGTSLFVANGARNWIEFTDKDVRRPSSTPPGTKSAIVTKNGERFLAEFSFSRPTVEFKVQPKISAPLLISPECPRVEILIELVPDRQHREAALWIVAGKAWGPLCALFGNADQESLAPLQYAFLSDLGRRNAVVIRVAPQCRSDTLLPEQAGILPCYQFEGATNLFVSCGFKLPAAAVPARARTLLEINHADLDTVVLKTSRGTESWSVPRGGYKSVCDLFRHVVPPVRVLEYHRFKGPFAFLPIPYGEKPEVPKEPVARRSVWGEGGFDSAASSFGFSEAAAPKTEATSERKIGREDKNFGKNLEALTRLLGAVVRVRADEAPQRAWAELADRSYAVSRFGDAHFFFLQHVWSGDPLNAADFLSWAHMLTGEHCKSPADILTAARKVAEHSPEFLAHAAPLIVAWACFDNKGGEKISGSLSDLALAVAQCTTCLSALEVAVSARALSKMCGGDALLEARAYDTVEKASHEHVLTAHVPWGILAALPEARAALTHTSASRALLEVAKALDLKLRAREELHAASPSGALGILAAHSGLVGVDVENAHANVLEAERVANTLDTLTGWSADESSAVARLFLQNIHVRFSHVPSWLAQRLPARRREKIPVGEIDRERFYDQSLILNQTRNPLESHAGSMRFEDHAGKKIHALLNSSIARERMDGVERALALPTGKKDSPGTIALFNAACRAAVAISPDSRKWALAVGKRLTNTWTDHSATPGFWNSEKLEVLTMQLELHTTLDNGSLGLLVSALEHSPPSIPRAVLSNLLEKGSQLKHGEELDSRLLERLITLNPIPQRVRDAESLSTLTASICARKLCFAHGATTDVWTGRDLACDRLRNFIGLMADDAQMAGAPEPRRALRDCLVQITSLSFRIDGYLLTESTTALLGDGLWRLERAPAELDEPFAIDYVLAFDHLSVLFNRFAMESLPVESEWTNQNFHSMLCQMRRGCTLTPEFQQLHPR